MKIKLFKFEKGISEVDKADFIEMGEMKAPKKKFDPINAAAKVAAFFIPKEDKKVSPAKYEARTKRIRANGFRAGNYALGFARVADGMFKVGLLLFITTVVIKSK